MKSRRNIHQAEVEALRRAETTALKGIADALTLIADGFYGPAQVPLRDALDNLRSADELGTAMARKGR